MVIYRYKPAYAAGDNTNHYGLIAEDVARVYPTLVQRGPDGKPDGVLYGEMPRCCWPKYKTSNVRSRHCKPKPAI